MDLLAQRARRSRPAPARARGSRSRRARTGRSTSPASRSRARACSGSSGVSSTGTRTAGRARRSSPRSSSEPAARGLRRLGAAGDGADAPDALLPQPRVLGCERRVALHVLRDVRVDLPADPVLPDGAGIHAARGGVARAAVDGDADARRADRGCALRPHRRPTVMAVGLALQAIGLAWIAPVIDATVGYGSLVSPFILSGIGMGMFFAPVANVVLSAVRPQEEGKASGANNAIREVGGVLGVAVLASVFAREGGYASAVTLHRRGGPGALDRCGGRRRRLGGRARDPEATARCGERPGVGRARGRRRGRVAAIVLEPGPGTARPRRMSFLRRWYGRRVPPRTLPATGRRMPSSRRGMRASRPSRAARSWTIRTAWTSPSLGIPFDTATTNRPGARFGPEAIRSASIALRPYNAVQRAQVFGALSVADLGDVRVTPGNAERTVGQIAEQLEPVVVRERARSASGETTSSFSGSCGHMRPCTARSVSFCSTRTRTSGTRIAASATTTAHRSAGRSRKGFSTRVARSWRACAVRCTGRRISAWRGIRVRGDPLRGARHADRGRVRRASARARGGGAGLPLLRRGRPRPGVRARDGDARGGRAAPREALGFVRSLRGLSFSGFDVVEVSPPYDGPGQTTAVTASNIAYELLTLDVLAAAS